MIRQADQLCDQWRQAWESGAPLSIASLVESDDVADRDETVARLLRMELAARHGRGETPTVEEYWERLPQYRSIVDSVFGATSAADVTVSFAEHPSGSSSLVDTVCGEAEGDGQDRADVAGSAGAAERQRIGRYVVLSRLGRGGQANVYRAVHPTLPIEVAIKLTHQSLPASQRLALQQEAHILCDLDHPQIARIRDFDFDDGHPFLVLDFIRGRSLKQVASNQTIAPPQAAELVAKVARGMDYAHSRGVLHRDLKPENIVIDEHSQPKIIDFGMSRLRSGIAGNAQETDGVSGTLVYMAPEQAAGIASQTDHRVDIFALGAILYRLLVGNLPYTAAHTARLLEVVRQGAWNQDALEQAPVPEALKAICRRAMAYDPDQRYATAGDMALDLENYVSEAMHPRGGGGSLMEPNAAMATAPKTPLKLSASGLGCVVSLTVGMAMLWMVTGPVLERVRSSLATPLSTSIGFDSRHRNSVPAPNGLPSAPAGDLLRPSRPRLINRFQVVHIGNSEDRAEFSGSLLQFRQPLENDDIQIEAEFSEPVYCFLVALNSDGSQQLLYPGDATIAQSTPLASLRYPADETSAFGLTDGAGHQAFVLFTSRAPLPPFESWGNDRFQASWPDPEAAGNWFYLEGQLQAIESVDLRDSQLTRGTMRTTKAPTAFKQLCDRLRSGDATDAQGVLFEVKPRL